MTDPFGSYIWAGSVATSDITGVQGAIIPNSLWANIPPAAAGDTQCGYINTSPPYFDTDCDGAADP